MTELLKEESIMADLGELGCSKVREQHVSSSVERKELHLLYSMDRKSSQRLLRDITNSKVRHQVFMCGKHPQCYCKDRSASPKYMINKEDLHKIRLQLSRRIQQQKGRSRIENLLFFQKLQKKQQGCIMLEAKTILLNLKSGKDPRQFDRCPPLDAKLSKPFSKITVDKSHQTTCLQNLASCSASQLDKIGRSNLHDRSFKSLFQPSIPQRNNTSAILERINSPIEDSDDNANTKAFRKLNNIQIRTMSKLIPKKKDHALQLAESSQIRAPLPVQKLIKYRHFLSKINFANKIFVQQLPTEPYKKLVYYIGKGNNSLLIKSLMKRRCWWVEGPLDQANFVWTQLKKTEFLSKQSQFRQEAPHQYSTHQCSLANQFSRSIVQSPKHRRYRPSFSISSCNKILNNNETTQYFQNSKGRQLRKVEPKYVHNHFSGNCHLGNKKALFFNLKHYCQLTNRNLFQMVPLTYHIGDDYKAFQKQFKRRAQLIKQGNQAKVSNVWIVKPGENSNRGNGIHVISTLKQLDDLLAQRKTHSNGQQLTYIVQLYMNKPFLYNKRKFDIRHYMLITSSGNCMRAYWYREGYIRTSSQLFDLEDTRNSQIHLTNDAIQKYSDSYGKYEQGNKLSYSQFQRYLDIQYKEKKFQFGDTLQKMKQIAMEAVKATFLKLDPNHRQFNFQIFGLDFMLDQNLRPWLIEVNTNPCLELSSNLLGRIIPNMVEHAFRVSLDSLFPPPNDYPSNQRHFLPNRAQEHLKFEIMFSSEVQGIALMELFRNGQQPELGNIQQQEQEFQDEGKQINFVQ